MPRLLRIAFSLSPPAEHIKFNGVMTPFLVETPALLLIAFALFSLRSSAN